MPKQTLTRLLILINAIGFAAMVSVNSLSNSLPLNGHTPEELSDKYPNLFVPAGFTFAIWGLIYLLLLIWVLGQVLALFNRRWLSKIEDSIHRTGWWFAATCLFNIGWIFAWHWEQLALSVGVMMALLASLLALNKSIGNGVSQSSRFEKNLAQPAFGIYQGWITVALIANFTTFLVGSGWQGGAFPQAIWAAVLIAVGAGLAIYMVWQRNLLFHGVAVAWALWGIYAKREALGDANLVAYAALAAMVLVLVTVVLNARKWVAY